jgi:hypothetical protein
MPDPLPSFPEKLTTTLLVYHRLLPNVPEAVAAVTGGVLSTFTAGEVKFALLPA